MTWRGWLSYVVLLFVTAVVQVGILNGIVVGGAHPDAFLLLAVAAGLVAGAQQGAILAFVAGLVADLFVVTPYGLSALCLVLVSFGVGLAAGTPGARSSVGFRVATALIASVGGTLLYAAVETLIGQPHPRLGHIVAVCLVVAIANGIGIVPVVRLLARVVSAGSVAQRGPASLSGGSAAVR